MTIRDATTYELLLRHTDQPEGPGFSYAFSPDGSALYYANHLRVVRWDLSSNELRILAGTDIDGVANPNQVALSPDGRRLAVAGISGGVALLDATSGQVLATAEHDRSVLWGCFHPRGRNWRPPSPPSPTTGERSRCSTVTAWRHAGPSQISADRSSQAWRSARTEAGSHMEPRTEPQASTRWTPVKS